MDVLERVRLAVAGARVRDGGALEELIAALLEVGRTGSPGDSFEALRALTERPALLLHLDAFIRREWWHPTRPTPGLAEADPVVLAVAASHADGRIRERAVRRMLDQPHPGTMPFLVLRTSDWVRQVRDTACAGLAVLLHANPLLATPATVRTALLINRRRRGAFAHAQLLVPLLTRSTTALAGTLLTAPEAPVRRFALDAVAHRLGLRDLAALAERDPDRQVRARAAEAAARQAVWTDQAELLRRLARSRHAEVRITALTGLMRTGSPQTVVPYLDDPSALIRALAREAARRTGTDPLAHYRAAVQAAEPQVGAIGGLAETGGRAYVPLLTALLDNPAPQVRAHVLRALRSLDVVPVPRVTALLRDDSAAVVKEAAAALLPSATHLPADLLWDMLTDPQRPAVRRAGYRLLSRRDRFTALRAAVLASGDTHPRLAARGRTDATTRIRELTPHPWITRPVPALGADPAQAAELLTLAEEHRTVLTEGTVHLLRDVLRRVPGSR
ncbi:HEAT repeat domain-containing protein [Streptomyces sp. SP17BM10]|uniref:HEAT repeat domain-containing protein n=1 Tax=Streptomyces sp. SP17BM10 TaxID=3002530 RepID=UPI002E7A4626|nr:HEAT repeat domain-containing protein [Streptomyces sp. SP17BM10]MEE1782704.1 HEAT repeat domain-containing protein [Streptomyces sp. SP17BM10]